MGGQREQYTTHNFLQHMQSTLAEPMAHGIYATPVASLVSCFVSLLFLSTWCSISNSHNSQINCAASIPELNGTLDELIHMLHAPQRSRNLSESLRVRNGVMVMMHI